MKALALLGCLALEACAAAPRRATLAPPTGPVASLTKRIVMLDGAVACPISPRLAYTAGHVVDGEGTLSWLSPDGESGTITDVHRFEQDLALIRSDTPFPYFSRVAREGPEVGDEVTIGTRTQFMLELPGAALFRGHVFGIHEGGDLFLDATGAPGASGGCVWNAQGEVIAVDVGLAAWPSHPWVRTMNRSIPVWGIK